MGEETLSDVMQSMSDGDIQVLVCTTIIETGLDIPNVNTLVIENADRLGLSQLHQLRGRVGRSSRHAYAYFTYKPDKALTEVAEKRLTAIRTLPSLAPALRLPCGIWRSGERAICWGPSSRDTWYLWDTICT